MSLCTRTCAWEQALLEGWSGDPWLLGLLLQYEYEDEYDDSFDDLNSSGFGMDAAAEADEVAVSAPCIPCLQINMSTP